jgi:gamma-glutamylaminecyclotransferase
MSLLFVYGSLKEGFPNFHINQGRRLPGDYVTVEPYPLFLHDGQLPCLLPTAGTGLRVRGQVFEVTPEALAATDALERVGEEGGYRRIEIEVEVVPAGADAAGSPRLAAFVYVQDPRFLDRPGEHVGPIDEYTLDHAQSLRW